MEHFRRRSSAESGVSFMERALNGLTTQRAKSPSALERRKSSEDIKGPLGLNLLYKPSEPLVDFIFVHGLGGGSRKTWTKTADPYHYWPKEWLPRDPDFKNTRISSFGYIADWGARKDSVLEINDFAHSLLGEIKNNPEIRKQNTRIVLVGHSMGGLVIKKTYILARQDPAFNDLASRFHSAYFLATPHRGSDLARTLTNILKVTYGQKLYVNQLEPNSDLISGINDTFRHYAQDLQLWSFYETLHSNLVLSNVMVVDRNSATLGYPQERTALLNADHRGMCKFDRPSDPNYKTLRNAFSTTVDAIVSEAFRFRQETCRCDLRRLTSLIGISNRPKDDLLALQDARVQGSCEWFTSKKEFEQWRMSWSSAPSTLWLSGNPTSGKSILASHVINNLEEQSLDCSYFFFKQGMASKSSVGDCLRSLAYQMALCSVDVRSKLLQLEEDGVIIDKNDERAIWRKIFLEAVFQSRSAQPHYWVVDALDECGKAQSFFQMISTIESHIPLRIFITSRKTQEIERSFGQLHQNVIHQELLVSDTVEDIKLFIAARMDRLPIENSASGTTLTNKILTKSNGSFLWVRLVVQELEHTWSEEGVEEVLNEIPADMNLLYMRILENMSKVSRAAKLAKAILTWTVCASRPLTLSEMQCALKLDINETVHSLDKSITSICGQLVFVDQRSRIQMIHQTARDFLLQESLDSEFAIEKSEGHMRLAVKCLDLLSGNQLSASSSQKKKLGIKSVPIKDLALADYASSFFSSHLYKTSSLNSEPWDALYDFLCAMDLKAYLERRTKYFPPIGQQFLTVEAWSIDLIRVSVKFQTILLTSPSSIYWLIPPMCPAESIIAKTFTSPHRGLTVKGSHSRNWDDCLTQIDFHSSQAIAIDHGDRFFAVGLSSGKISIYHSISGQVNRVVDHCERVKILVFGSQDKLLASSGLRSVLVWDLSTGNLVWSFNTRHQIIALAFTSENECLMAASQGGYVSCWHLLDGIEKFRIPWHDGFEDTTNKTRQQQPPTLALFSPGQNILAVSYRGRPILLFDIESEVFLGNCIRRSASSISSVDTHYPVVAMAFNPSRDINLLVASYGDGELTVYNPRTLELKHRAPEVNAQALACSPDGRTLVTGSSFGTIQVFDFDGAGDGCLRLFYRIDAYEKGIKSLTFSSDSLRFIDIRGSQCRVWGPAVLVRKDLLDCDQSEISDPAPMANKSAQMIEGENKAEITAMACHSDGDIVFCGKQDGSIVTCSTQDGKEVGMLYNHATNIAVTHIVWGSRKNILVSADESGRIMIRTVLKTQTGWLASDILADQRLPESICGLLISPSNDQLLVSGNQCDELWTIQGRKLGSKTFTHQKFRNAMLHPHQTQALLVIEPTVARILSWADLTDLTNSEGVKLCRFRELATKNSLFNVSYQGSILVAELLKMSGEQASTILECWNIGSMGADTMSIMPLEGLEMLGPSIEHIIAITGTILLFLDTDLWVCSLDLKKFAMIPEAKRHFFIPSDWKSNTSDIIFHYTSKNEFVLAHKDKLSIIKRGLDYAETISFSKS